MFAIRVTNFIANALSVIAVLAVIAALLFWVIRRPYFLVDRMVVESVSGQPLQYVQLQELAQTIEGKITGGFFDINLEQAREALEKTPWVRRAQVRRQWPNQLQVKLEEQEPLAFWNHNYMINRWGEVFYADKSRILKRDEAIDIPQLNGPENSERLVIQRYAELARWVAPTGLAIEQVTLSPRYAWDVVLSNGMQLLIGRDPAADATDPHGRAGAHSFAARLERFIQAWPKLSEQLAGRGIARADLRYNDGFAITLAPQANSE